MITKERLEELIKQKATIYYIFEDVIFRTKEIIPITLNDGASFDITTAFETKEEAEFELEFGNITRTETLKLPTWEEFLDEPLWFKDDISFLIKENKEVRFFKTCFSKFSKIVVMRDAETLFDKSLTKENYIEACKLCKKLFLGEEV